MMVKVTTALAIVKPLRLEKEMATTISKLIQEPEGDKPGCNSAEDGKKHSATHLFASGKHTWMLLTVEDLGMPV
jgi:hypothetical protein